MLVIDSVQAQTIANNVITWIYPTDLGPNKANVITEDRYPDAPIKITIEEARAVHKMRTEEAARSRGGN